jgi:UDP-3-O-[3-hydroxymyristoyl] glucosamine N-acyltransferase
LHVITILDRDCELKFESLNDNWNFLKPLDWPKLKKSIKKQLERADKLIAKFDSEQLRSITKIKSEKLKSIEKAKSEQLTSTNNARNLPSYATIREEYVTCGKVDCPSKHGPYYYAYWKDNGKTNKKYIGKYYRPVENTNKDKSSDMDHASRDALPDPSKNS